MGGSLPGSTTAVTSPKTDHPQRHSSVTLGVDGHASVTLGVDGHASVTLDAATLAF
jgi:hypothetical protein